MIIDIVYGFLGSGKTTFITRVLQSWGDREKIVVLVNEFGEVGIDGALLAGQGGNVVEMPSGCICCTIQADFRTQMLDIYRTINPERVIVEPTGVATIKQIRTVFAAQMFEKVIKRINCIQVADALDFMRLYKANRYFVESQVQNAHLVLLNKCDRVEKRQAALIQAAVSAINPDISVLMTEFGAVDWDEYHSALVLGREKVEEKWPDLVFVDDREKDRPEIRSDSHFPDHPEEDALGYQSFGREYTQVTFILEDLKQFFSELQAAEMGEVVRAKGIFQIKDQWLLLELASGEFSSQIVQPSDRSRISIIGRDLDHDQIGEALHRCIRGAIF